MKEYYSTVEAANLCSVTRFSVINWTNQGKLKTCKTPGGHRRIHRADLIAFIKTYGIGLEAIKSEAGVSQSDLLRCWQYHGSAKPSDIHDCQSCVVFISGTKKCFTLREHVDHRKIFCKTPCEVCEYYNTVINHEK